MPSTVNTLFLCAEVTAPILKLWEAYIISMYLYNLYPNYLEVMYLECCYLLHAEQRAIPQSTDMTGLFIHVYGFWKWKTLKDAQ